MARGSIGRERIISGVVGSQPPNALQDDLNKELLAVSLAWILLWLKLVIINACHEEKKNIIAAMERNRW